MKANLLISALLLQASSYVVTGFSTSSGRNGLLRQTVLQRPTGVVTYPPSLPLRVASSQSSAQDQPVTTDDKQDKKKDELKKLRAHGGPLTFNTPIGALNPFAIYYGLMSLFLGIPWFIALKSCQLLYWITGGRFDQKRRLPVFFSHVWGTVLMRLSRSYPEMVGLEKLEEFFKKDQAALFVANHCSWMDIPFLGATVGWRNYKLVSKKELCQIPILGTAITLGDNITIDRSNRRSQLKTLKDGIAYLKKNIHLCTFPEGTRSRTGRLLPFKNGSFKMAHKAGAPVIPLSIVNSNKVMPPGWMFASKASHGLAKVIIHDPVESVGKTEDELAAEVRRRMISGLPEDQKPLNEKA